MNSFIFLEPISTGFIKCILSVCLSNCALRQANISTKTNNRYIFRIFQEEKRKICKFVYSYSLPRIKKSKKLPSRAFQWMIMSVGFRWSVILGQFLCDGAWDRSHPWFHTGRSLTTCKYDFKFLCVILNSLVVITLIKDSETIILYTLYLYGPLHTSYISSFVLE
jgi:hypothetical protein